MMTKKMLTEAELNRRIGERLKEYREAYGYSQGKIAQMLGISKGTYQNYENGKTTIRVDILKRLAELYGVSLQDIVYGERAEQRPEKKGPSKPSPQIRINIPARNIRKFKELLLYILRETRHLPQVGETVLHKILYFIDFDFYEKYERQLIGATYIKNHFGPTAKEFIKVVGELQKENALEVHEVEKEIGGKRFLQRIYIPLREPDLSQFSALEKEEVDRVLRRFSGMTARQISAYSHGDVPWKVTPMGQEIDYELVFYRTPEYSVRDYEEEEQTENPSGIPIQS